MNDCTNAEMRDALPDLLHERLDAAQRMIVVAHVDGCVDCREELALLRQVRASLAARTPAINVATIVRALPAAPSAGSARPLVVPRRRPAWADWRIAAAAAVVIAASSSIAVYNARPVIAVNASATVQATLPAAVSHAIGHDTALPTVASSVAPSVAPVSATTTVASADEQAANADIGGDNRLGDLDEQQLQDLLDEVQSMRAVPPTEPEPVRMRIGGMENVSIGGGA